jgi:hypothetical protein
VNNNIIPLLTTYNKQKKDYSSNFHHHKFIESLSMLSDATERHKTATIGGSARIA